ncbi:nuclear transport factor 2 family protein [Kitasatospora acidiphila]|uniref:Nuclear transport factor 2 family protein n=1 Tax=Kitasatospora acidiphila TaxID=2567942 RepID=A0A540W2A7_9ACTN|nr:nuclear transport factor 2 family protein [Kitasatospora acidiphila]TQF03151.1 nuclear transport factor 2 family protein [Kitasatospora acidiphila]
MADGPLEIFEQFRTGLLAGAFAPAEELWAEDAVVEFPYAPEGRPQQFTGRAEFLAFAATAQAERPVCFEDFQVLALRDAADPGVLIAEYRLTGPATAGGRRGTAVFVLLLRVRDGRIVHWREYQDLIAPRV